MLRNNVISFSWLYLIDFLSRRKEVILSLRLTSSTKLKSTPSATLLPSPLPPPRVWLIFWKRVQRLGGWSDKPSSLAALQVKVLGVLYVASVNTLFGTTKKENERHIKLSIFKNGRAAEKSNIEVLYSSSCLHEVNQCIRPTVSCFFPKQLGNHETKPSSHVYLSRCCCNKH